MENQKHSLHPRQPRPSHLGDCSRDAVCEFYRPHSSGYPSRNSLAYNENVFARPGAWILLDRPDSTISAFEGYSYQHHLSKLRSCERRWSEVRYFQSWPLCGVALFAHEYVEYNGIPRS